MTGPLIGAPWLSVVIATFNRPESVARLLGQLAEQTLRADAFEVVVVDDGSAEPVAPRLEALVLPYALRVVTQPNGGPAVARHRAIVAARAPLVVIVDDDMRVGPGFLAAHLAAHPAGSRRLVLGRLRVDPDTPLPVFERFQLAQLDRLADDARTGRAPVRGSDVYTGNVSLRRDDYLAVGGFDATLRLSEDAELGMRLERAGVEMTLSEDAWSLHASDHASAAAWMRRARAYGAADGRIADKHAGDAALHGAADPWRFLFQVNPVSRPLLLASALAPSLAQPVARVAMAAARAADALGMGRVAVAGCTFVYGMQYFAGLRDHAGSRGAARERLRRYLNGARPESLGPIARVAKCAADVRADHDAITRSDAKYKAAPRRGSIAADAIRKIGFQMMIAYRVMRLFRALRLTPLAMITSRVIRHLYGADIHWDAELAPGVVLVHGVGLVVSHAARVGPGCILFQHVTLGESIHATRREVGAPTLGADVHVGPGATLLGPITIGEGTKITAGALVMDSVPAHHLVETAAATVRPRTRAAARAAEPVDEAVAVVAAS